MGRSPLSWLPTIKRFRDRGYKTFSFKYSVARQDFPAIVHRLTNFLDEIGRAGPYIAIGHSLGGVLLRTAIDQIGNTEHLPKKLFLLGSPVHHSKIAFKLQRNPVFQVFTQDCGQLLSSSKRMACIPKSRVPTLAIIGNKGLKGKFSPFGTETNDGIVSESETTADWFQETVKVPVIHSILPSSKKVADAIFSILQRS